MHHERRNMNENKSNDLQTIITQVIEEMKSEQGDKFDLNKINLAEMERRTGLTRAQLRRIKTNRFLVVPHALTGRKATSTIISGYTGVIDDLLKKNVSNSEVILERIQEQGYTGSLTTVKRYISEHKDLMQWIILENKIILWLKNSCKEWDFQIFLKEKLKIW